MPESKKRSAGILLPAFTPRRERDLGVGDTLALREWIDWAATHRVGFLQLLPINENGAEESPYSSISSTALDPIYLALDDPGVPGLRPEDLERARHQLGEALNALLVDYPAVRRVKRNLLELAWSKFDSADESARGRFEKFREAEASWLEDYCLFRLLMERQGEGKSWDQWPADVRTPAKARAWLAKERRLSRDETDYRVNFYAFVQWICFNQWRALRAYADECGVKLMGDVPIGVSWHSSDVFFSRDEFHTDWCGGSPAEPHVPDPFFAQWGQNWGIPLYRWEHMHANGYAWWKTRIARLLEVFQMFRLDHVLGFYRIYAFPWRPERNAEFIGLDRVKAAAMNRGRLPRWFLRSDETLENREANRADGDTRLRGILDGIGNAEVIAEDLGMVPDYVRPHLAGLGIAGFKIPHWDCDEHGHPMPPDQFPELAFATYSTHDHEPLAGIWNGCLRAIRRHAENPGPHTEGAARGAAHSLRILSEFADIPVPRESDWLPYTDGVHWRLIKSLFDCRSRYVLLMITEVFRLEDRFNHPGTVGGINWRYRLPWSIDEIKSAPELSQLCTKLATMISLSRRG